MYTLFISILICIFRQIWRLLEGAGGEWEERELFLCPSCPAVDANWILSWGEDDQGKTLTFTYSV